jgi:hypothetical protein
MAIKIGPTCRGVDILFEIKKKIESLRRGKNDKIPWDKINLSIREAVFFKTSEILRFFPKDFLEIPEVSINDEKIKISAQPLKFAPEGKYLSRDQFALFENGIIRTFKFKIGDIFTAGNFPLLLEDYSLISYEITINDEFSDILDIVTEINTEYEIFNIETINKFNYKIDKMKRKISLENSTGDVIIDDMTFDMKKNFDYLYCLSEKIFFYLGTFTFLKKGSNVYNDILNVIKIFEDKLIDTIIERIAEPDVDDNKLNMILLMFNILKYNHYRVNLDPEEKEIEKSSNFPQQLKKEINAIIDMKICNVTKDKQAILENLQFLRLLNYAYLNGMIDGENYNYHKGKEIMRKHATKSAVAAIMSRNMSHNIGSHVLSFVKNELDGIEEINTQKYPISETANYKNTPYLKGVSHLINYIQERQDFIATISSFEGFSFMPVDLWNTVFGNFINFEDDPDHPEKINLILSNIACSENYTGKEILIVSKKCGLLKKECSAFNLFMNIKLSIPYGIMGRQAIYSIFENFIRNSAKHTPFEKGKKLEIIIDTPHYNYSEKDKIVQLSFHENYLYINEERKVKLKNGDVYEYKEKWIKYYCIDSNGAKIYLKMHRQNNEKVFYEERTDKIFKKYNSSKDKPTKEEIFDITRFDEHVYKEYYLKNTGEDVSIELGIDSEKDCFTAIINDEKYSILDYNPNEFIKFTLSNNMNDYFQAATDLEKGLRDDFIDKETGKLNPLYKGIKEIKISAAWLRGIDIAEINQIDFYPPIIDIRCSRGKSKCPALNKCLKYANEQSNVLVDGCVEYVFYLLRPKELLILVTSETLKKLKANSQKKEDEDFESFQARLHFDGIEILGIDDFKRTSNLRHRLNVIEQALTDKVNQKDEIEKMINQRKIFLNSSEIIDIIESNNKPRSILETFWKKRLENSHNAYINKPIIIIDKASFYVDDQNKVDDNDFIIHKEDADIKSIDDIQILFRYHNDTIDEFIKFKNFLKNKSNEESDEIYKKLEFIEGISAGNSTDLLIRKLPKTKLFKYQLIESCLTRVLIIDERIWSRYSKKRIDDIHIFFKNPESTHRYKLLKKLDEIKNIGSETEWIEELNKVIKEFHLPNIDNSKDLYFISTQPELIVNKLGIESRFDITDKEISKNNYYDWFSKKNIDVLSTIFDSDKAEFCFYNLRGIRIGTFNKNGFKFKEKNSTPPYDFLCIHQGIIDKIHDQLNMTFEKIYEEINKIENTKSKVVNSGRGIPPNFPKNIIFLPFSSLENAVYDCKFSLTEFLYNSKMYKGEKDDNH